MQSNLLLCGVHAELWHSSHCAPRARHHHAHGQVIHNTTILKDNIQRQICIGNASFVDLGLETEQVTIAAGMAAASG